MLTLLTSPLPIGKYYLSENSKKIYRKLRDLLNRPKYNYGAYGGHYAVTRSICFGLDNLKIEYNYNPKNISDIYKNMVVLAGVDTLKQAIHLKESGLINKLIAGPNIITYASEYNEIIASEQIDLIITPSDWVSKLYIDDCINLRGRIASWPAGVDVNYWSPLLSSRISKKNILIYNKLHNNVLYSQLISDVTIYLKSLDYNIIQINYGSFNHYHYLSLLRNSVLLVGFSLSESQGIAWAEAWSTNIPTFIFEINTSLHNARNTLSSSAPYLNSLNGKFFNNLDEFKKLIKEWTIGVFSFEPRKWVLENMSDEICARQMLEYLN